MPILMKIGLAIVCRTICTATVRQWRNFLDRFHPQAYIVGRIAEMISMLTRNALKATRGGLPIVDIYVYLQDRIVVWTTDGEVKTLRIFPNEQARERHKERSDVTSA